MSENNIENSNSKMIESNDKNNIQCNEDDKQINANQNIKQNNILNERSYYVQYKKGLFNYFKPYFYSEKSKDEEVKILNNENNNELNTDNKMNNSIYDIDYSIINESKYQDLERLKHELKEGVDFKLKKIEEEFKLDENIINNINNELKKGVDWEMEHFKTGLNCELNIIRDILKRHGDTMNYKDFINGIMTGTLITSSLIFITLKYTKYFR